jgi:hypothetical protein
MGGGSLRTESVVFDDGVLGKGGGWLLLLLLLELELVALLHAFDFVISDSL